MIRYLDSKVVSMKGEKFTEIKKAEDDSMKNTYINLKPARQYRFHWIAWSQYTHRELKWECSCLYNNICILAKVFVIYIFVICILNFARSVLM